jgi:hypothetical protein
MDEMRASMQKMHEQRMQRGGGQRPGAPMPNSGQGA